MSIQVEFNQAAQPFAQERAGLFRDGKPLYAPDVQAEKLADLEQRRAAALGAITDRAKASAEAELAAVATEEIKLQRDPLLTLDAPSLARAGALRPFIAEDIAAQPLDQLARYLDAVRLRGDRVEQVLAVRYAGQRIDGAAPSDDLAPAGKALRALRDALTTPAEIAALNAIKERRSTAQGLLSWAVINHPNREHDLRSRSGRF